MTSPPQSLEPRRVVAVSSNKGGVGKTTLATNLAVYLRALREDLPVLVVSLDDQRSVDRMFALREPAPGDANLKHGWAERSLTSAIQLGQYGVHFVPSPPDVTLLKSRAEDPRTLARILDQTEWPGLVVLDTKSDLEALTRNAWCAADRVLVPVADAASLEEAGKVFRWFLRHDLDPGDLRIVFSLVDRRSRVAGGGDHLYQRLVREVCERGWPYYRTRISRSPRVETLMSGSDRPLSILHHARGTAVHAQLHDLALELLYDLSLSERLPALEDPGPDELWGEAARAAGSTALPPGRPAPRRRY